MGQGGQISNIWTAGTLLQMSPNISGAVSTLTFHSLTISGLP